MIARRFYDPAVRLSSFGRSSVFTDGWYLSVYGTSAPHVLLMRQSFSGPEGLLPAFANAARGLSVFTFR
jgi:hypothetical protein